MNASRELDALEPATPTEATQPRHRYGPTEEGETFCGYLKAMDSDFDPCLGCGHEGDHDDNDGVCKVCGIKADFIAQVEDEPTGPMTPEEEFDILDRWDEPKEAYAERLAEAAKEKNEAGERA